MIGLHAAGNERPADEIVTRFDEGQGRRQLRRYSPQAERRRRASRVIARAFAIRRAAMGADAAAELEAAA
jgi:hypothetical protein